MRVPRFLNSIKEPIKQAHHRLRTEYIKRFYSFAPVDLGNLLRRMGVVTGDVMIVHSSFNEFLGFRGDVGGALRTLQDAVGSHGGILMPTQPFTGSAIDYVRTHPVTDLRRAPSLMGILSEILRRTPGTVRSVHPTHPVAAWGAKGLQMVANDWEARTPCGRGTAYYRLLEHDGKILMLGTGVQPMTFYHCVEELIEPLMPFSPFTAEEFTLQSKDVKGNVYTTRTRLLEPVLSANRRMSLLVPEMKSRGFWNEAKIGRLEVLLFKAVDVLEACQAMARKGQFCYLVNDRK
jgi:aminoglycoside N3'-acetyltransferase